ncbi:MAG: 16S rRNA (cytidine(1402)-2'-O)-methyltransferase [Oscillospiraceae bacterium]|nr:16S rRNA (cytidine(1402)-2'-O)-methyltransferase [Oscillospiraceae bacterium]
MAKTKIRGVQKTLKHGALYVVGTPIGNLSDISDRACDVLKKVDFIVAEDTRNSGRLLSKLEIENGARLTSYHEHNVKAKTGIIVERIKTGESCAIITDAGMPCISDPGEVLVRNCRKSDIPVYVVPGACAVTAALAVSGLSTSRYIFEGFLPSNESETKRRSRLEILKELPHTLVFYESPHKLIKTLVTMQNVFGERKVALCRELTKLYEEVLWGTFAELLSLYESKSPRGEYVMVIEGAAKPPKRTKINKYANIVD